MIGLHDTPPMVMQDPPVHTEFRKLVSRGFTPRQVETVEPTVRKFVVERLEKLRANGGGDIVTELFKPLPSMVVAPSTAFAATMAWVHPSNCVQSSSGTPR